MVHCGGTVVGSMLDCKAELKHAALLPLIEQLQLLKTHKQFIFELEVPDMNILVDSAQVFSGTVPNVSWFSSVTCKNSRFDQPWWLALGATMAIQPVTFDDSASL